MNEKNNYYKLAFILLLIILLMLPGDKVWGGYSFQTVPTIGPSPTPTQTQIPLTTQPTRTSTQVQSTATSTLVTNPSATAIIGITLESISTPQSTEAQQSEGLVPFETIENTPANEETEIIVLPTSEEIITDDVQEDQMVPGEETAIPAFVFPLVAVLLLVIIYLITKLTLKKTSNGNPSKKL